MSSNIITSESLYLIYVSITALATYDVQTEDHPREFVCHQVSTPFLVDSVSIELEKIRMDPNVGGSPVLEPL